MSKVGDGTVGAHLLDPDGQEDLTEKGLSNPCTTLRAGKETHVCYTSRRCQTSHVCMCHMYFFPFNVQMSKVKLREAR